MTTKQFPEWARTLYRGIRAGVAAGVVAVIALQPDMTKPESAIKVAAVAFGTAFLVSFGKWLREQLDVWFGYDEKSLIAKVIPF